MFVLLADSLKATSSNFIQKGVTDTICANLKANQGFENKGHNNCTLLTMLAFVQVLAYLYTSIKIDWLRYLSLASCFWGLLFFFAAPANLLLALLIAVYECCAKEDKARFG